MEFLEGTTEVARTNIFQYDTLISFSFEKEIPLQKTGSLCVPEKNCAQFFFVVGGCLRSIPVLGFVYR